MAPARTAAPYAEAPPTDCSAPVGYALNRTLPGYVVADAQLGSVCVPLPPLPPAPAGYEGDYHVTEFSDAAARERLAACQAQLPCPAIAYQQSYVPPQFRLTGSLVPFGRIDPHAANIDLRQIRRPGFFGAAPYLEPIAAAEDRTHTFEYTVPAEPYERINRAITTPVKLRGWYLTGAGIKDRPGRRRRALAIFVGGRTVETTAAQHPRDPRYTRSAAGGQFTSVAYPARQTEKWGMRQWRQYLHTLNQAGFDVLSFDKRGHGISGGISADNAFAAGAGHAGRDRRAADRGGRAHAGPGRHAAQRAPRGPQAARRARCGGPDADHPRRSESGRAGHRMGDERQPPPLV
jgi:hypothetical protein